jgi:serine/threonine protein phosphatase 1
MIVGDLHGCLDELTALCEKANLGPEDRLISVGDLVDRGPRSLEVVRFFAEKPLRRQAVLGNHEAKHLRGGFANGQDPSGRITRRQLAATEYQELVTFARSLPLWIDLEEATIVHAGLEPGLPLEAQDERVVTGRGSQGRPGWDGRSRWWFDDPALQWPKPIVFGHQIFPEVARGQRGNVWGLDTGASEGGRLTGLLLPGFDLVSVPTPDYWSEALAQWGPVLLAEDLRELPWRRVLELDPAELELPLSDRIARAQARLDELVGRIAHDVLELRESTGYDRLEPQQRAEVTRGLRAKPRFQTAYGRLVLRSFPSGPDRHAVMRAVPTPRAVEEMLGTIPSCRRTPVDV